MTLQEQKNCPMISSKATVASRNSLHWSCKPLIRLRKILASRSPDGEREQTECAASACINSTECVLEERSAVGRHEQLVHRNGRCDQRLVGQVLHQRLQRRPVRLDPVGPWIAIEEL